MHDRGFTLVEALVVMVLTVGVTGAVFSMVHPDSAMAHSQPEALDMQQRARVGVDALLRDLAQAGAGASAGAEIGPLHRHLPPIVPRRLGLTAADVVTVARPDVVTIAYARDRGTQTTIGGALSAGSLVLDVDTSPNCPIGRDLCGLQAGATAVVFDGAGAFDYFKVTAIRTPFADVRHLGGVASNAFSADASIVEAELHTYYFDASLKQLRHYDGDRTDVPVVDNVVDLAFEYFGEPNPPSAPKPPVGTANCLYDPAGNPTAGLAWLPTAGASLAPLPLAILSDGPWCGAGSTAFDADVLRIRQVRLKLRIQAAPAGLRGLGADYLIPGLGRDARRLLPDYGLTIDIAPRNLNLAR